METGLRDKTILVTGASGAIGSEISLAFDAEKARTILVYNRGHDRIQELSKRLTSPHIMVQADLAKENDVNVLFEASEKVFGRIDVLVSCAGVWSVAKSIADRSLVEWQQCMNDNLTSAFLLTRGFFGNLRTHKKDHAAIVYVGSTAGSIGEALHHDYASAKSGIMFGLVRSLKTEIRDFANRGRVNVVSPGWCATPMTESVLQEEKMMRRITSTIPLQKVATPKDIAAGAVFLASNRLSGHITGEILPVTGGMDGRLLYGELLG